MFYLWFCDVSCRLIPVNVLFKSCFQIIYYKLCHNFYRKFSLLQFGHYQPLTITSLSESIIPSPDIKLQSMNIFFQLFTIALVMFAKLHPLKTETVACIPQRGIFKIKLNLLLLHDSFFFFLSRNCCKSHYIIGRLHKSFLNK